MIRSALWLSLTTAFLLFNDTTYGQSGKFKTVEIKTEILCDHCLRCESCHANIYYTIKRETKGVRKVEVNPQGNTVMVKYKVDKTDPQEIEEAIAKAGFKANDLPPMAEARQKLDGCCKGREH